LDKILYLFLIVHPQSVCVWCILKPLMNIQRASQSVEKYIPARSPYAVLAIVRFSPLKTASHRIRLRLTIRLMANGSLPTHSKNTITGNPAYLNQL